MDKQPFPANHFHSVAPQVIYRLLSRRLWTTRANRFARVVQPRNSWPVSYGTLTVGDAPALHVVIAGGAGIAPMMSIMRTFADRGDERPIILLYGSRDCGSISRLSMC